MTTQASNTTPPRTASPVRIDTIGLTQDLTASTSPTSPHGAADAKRAMSSTDDWKPVLDRRQSWSSQEYKHELQQRMQKETDPAKHGGVSVGGFTERAT